MEDFLTQGGFPLDCLSARLAIALDEKRSKSRQATSKKIDSLGKAIMIYERTKNRIRLQVLLATNGFNEFNPEMIKDPEEFCLAWRNAIGLCKGAWETMH